MKAIVGEEWRASLEKMTQVHGQDCYILSETLLRERLGQDTDPVAQTTS
jgi:hypothetical protein